MIRCRLSLGLITNLEVLFLQQYIDVVSIQRKQYDEYRVDGEYEIDEKHIIDISDMFSVHLYERFAEIKSRYE